MKPLSEMSLRELVDGVWQNASGRICAAAIHAEYVGAPLADYFFELRRRLPALEAAADGMEALTNKGHANSFGQVAVAERFIRGPLDAYRAAKEAERNAD